ncbi:MAG: response regulator, partial [Myxococcales bacterium]|nr:response regulator [Myxococcales bacterium]
QGLLEGDGHGVITATNGREALVRAGVDGLSVVFCDISMGDGPDGYEVARTLRSRPELAHLKLVALTGFGTHLARERSLEAGFDVHLTKPVDLDVLRRTLRTLDT